MILSPDKLKILFCFIAIISLSGCVLNDMSDLEVYSEEVLARPGGEIEPIPVIEPYEAYSYQSGQAGKRDPFHVFFQPSEEEVAEAEDTGLTEEMEREIKNRNREELENFELDSLRMVGTIDDENNSWGVILDPDGTVHRVRVGNYLGTNIGKILNIFEDRIEIREIIKNSQGKWEERQAAIALAEE